ncbi:coiled-coil domain-containing protein 33 [Notolabrus celidotus]|uniref:coiled-coil domain-containing protein 33 n=1 Tax=Notolabrus celidotus TaxID=1203425 RepID=UPI0014908643|nr:coiled-coil domain-containing protein 33 [Notolabrus celidotus]
MKASKKTKSLSSPEAVQKHRYNLPSHDALAQILPNNRIILKGVKTELHRETKQEQKMLAKKPEATQANKPNINHTYQIRQPHKRPPLHDFEVDPRVAEISGLQTKEAENYCSAMSRMAEDIIVLRTQMVTLEAENSQLRIDLSLHQDLRTDPLDDSDIDSMAKAEISKHIASLKFKLATESNNAASQRDRIQQLQNDLIKKNDGEKELLKLQRVHQQQEDFLQHHPSHLAKMATLEATVKQQAKVIEKMEKALDSNLRERNKQSVDKMLVVNKQRGEMEKRKDEKESALTEENRRLREELDRTRQHPNAFIIPQSEQTLNERQILLHKVEQAEARAQILEAQLEENSKQWGKQKQEMLTKLSEHRHGFVRTSTTIFHNDTSKSVSEALRKHKPVK